MAADFDQWLAVDVLLEHGARVEVTDNVGPSGCACPTRTISVQERNTPMSIAIRTHVTKVKYLVMRAQASISLEQVRHTDSSLSLTLAQFIEALGKALDNNAFNSAGFLFAFNHTTMNVGYRLVLDGMLLSWPSERSRSGFSSLERMVKGITRPFALTYSLQAASRSRAPLTTLT